MLAKNAETSEGSASSGIMAVYCLAFRMGALSLTSVTVIITVAVAVFGGDPE